MAKHKELVEELNKHRGEVSKLRSALNELDREKELWFSKKEEHSKKIKENIRKIKESKAKRDELTKEVRELKTKRDTINKELKSKLEEFDKLKKEKSEIAKSLDVKESPSKIKQLMEKLEFKIETEAMPFGKEQDVMKKIKELRKAYDESCVLDEFNQKIKNANDSAKGMNKDSNETHALVQEKAKQSQAMHEEILNLSVEIDKLKVEEGEAFKKFSELKAKFNYVNSQLKEKLKSMNEVKCQLDKIYSDRIEKRKREEELFLKSKEEEVNQKIKLGKKLTTEDLLVFQKVGKG